MNASPFRFGGGWSLWGLNEIEIVPSVYVHAGDDDMFQLTRYRPLFTRAWFLASAAVAAFVLGVGVMAMTDQSPDTSPTSWATTISYPTHMEVIVRSTLDTASESLRVP